MNLSISEISKLTGIHRETVAKKLANLASTTGPKGAKLYDSVEALPLIYALERTEVSVREAKARSDMAGARLKEIAAEKAMGELVPRPIVRLALEAFVKFTGQRFEELRARGAIDRQFIDQCAARWKELLCDLCLQHGYDCARALLNDELLREFMDLRESYEKASQAEALK